MVDEPGEAMATVGENSAVALGHLGEVGTRRERLTGAGNHDHRNSVVGACGDERIGGSVVQGFVEGVACFGAIECEHSHTAVVGDVNHSETSRLMV